MARLSPLLNGVCSIDLHRLSLTRLRSITLVLPWADPLPDSLVLSGAAPSIEYSPVRDLRPLVRKRATTSNGCARYSRALTRSAVFRTFLTTSKGKASDAAFVAEAPKESAVGRVGEQPRAQRFAIHALLRYRAPDGEWQQGTIVNISESGVLFQTSQEAPSIRELEMRFSLPTGVAGEAAAQMECRGVVTRTVSLPGSAEATGIAARITKFHFVRANTSGLKEV